MGQIKQCVICNKEFETIPYGAGRKFCFSCSPQEASRASQITLIRRSVKHQLVLYKGGKCEICGYDKCERALEFHHLDPTQKEFTISGSLNHLSDFNMEKYYSEVDKCILVCSNCHAEIHEKENDNTGA